VAEIEPIAESSAGASAHPETIRATLHIPNLGNGGLDIPYFDIRGSREGPQLTVLAGVHGAEYTSIAAVRKFVREIDPAEVSGRILAVPVVNVPAFWARSPFVVPGDGKNLNRSFPGDPNGTFAEVLAERIFTSFIAGADFLVDLHAGDLPESLMPFTIFDESPVEAASRELSVAYGLSHSVRQSASGRIVAGSSCAAAAAVGIPSLVAESGQNGLLERPAIDAHLAGLRNLARFVGVLDGDPWPVREVHEHQGWDWMYAERAGWWEPALAIGSSVEAGDLVGTVTDVWGEECVEVRAPGPGTFLFHTASPAVAADGILAGIGRG
jgi:predicted deacylase